jgi:excisionase family DNA binding protein
MSNLKWVTTTEIANRIGLSARYLRDEIRDGRLKAMKFGTRGGRGTYRVPADVAENYVKRMLGHLYDVSM